MKKFCLILILSFTALLVGCASIARDGSASEQVFRELSSAALGAKAIGAVERGQSSTLKIGVGSPSLDLPDIKGKFEIISIKGQKQRAFKLSVDGLCDCMGFRKWTVSPSAYLVDGSGNTISTMVRLAPTVVVLKGNFPADGVYQLVVVADGTRVGGKVGSVGGGAMLPGGPFVPNLFTIPMTAQPTGKLVVAFHADEK